MGGFGGKGAVCLFARAIGLSAGCLLLANCGMSGKIDPKYGVAASARVVEPGQPVPKGGGVYRVGKPYTIAGRTFVPEENINYSAVGLASWYGDDFHGRYTANGEIFDMNSISAAHPTLPLPSYVRVTNVSNRRSIVVRVNDRGPYVGSRIIDLSVKTAKLLGFHGNGLAKVKVEYVGRAPLAGSDDRKLMATLRDGTTPAAEPPVMVASNKPFAQAYFDSRPMAEVPRPPERPYGGAGSPTTAEAEPDAAAGPTTELPAAARPQTFAGRFPGPATPQLPPPIQTVSRAPVSASAPSASAVSAYAPTRYDGGAGFMSGRGLY